MKIVVDDKGFDIDGHRLIYDLYYFESEQYDAPTLAATFKKILNKWANVLRESTIETGDLFLPYALDDEWTECLKAVQHDNRIILRCTRVAENGWAINVSHLEEFMTSTHVVDKEANEVFGDYDKDEFIAALINAQIIIDE